MTVERFAISFDKKLAREVRRSAGKQPISSWLAEAAEAKLRSKRLRRVVEDWESIHGKITEEEIEAVRREQEQAIARAQRRRGK